MWGVGGEDSEKCTRKERKIIITLKVNKFYNEKFII